MYILHLEKMGDNAAALIAIGTHGTMGNLLMKEIQYYKRLELDNGGDRRNSNVSSLDPDKKHGGSGSGGSAFWCGFGFFKTKWQRKQGNGGISQKFLPRICMMADATEGCHNHHQRRHANKIPGFNYHNLEDDTKQYKIW
ncbi:hypothetical protein Hdeb2414_s0134g00807911 [Helianthus debilis subsp. tardiflorus]